MAKKSQIVNQTQKEPKNLSPIYDDAVKNINQMMEQSASKIMDIGKYLLEKFFDGDVAAAKSRSPQKGLSLRTLSLREDIDCSYSTLSRSIDAAVVHEEMGTVAASQQLTASHYLILASVEDANTREEYANIALTDNLSSRQLKNLLVKDDIVAVRGRGALKALWEQELAKSHLLGVYRACDAISQIESVGEMEMGKTATKKALEKAEEARSTLDKIIKELKNR